MVASAREVDRLRTSEGGLGASGGSGSPREKSRSPARTLDPNTRLLLTPNNSTSRLTALLERTASATPRIRSVSVVFKIHDWYNYSRSFINLTTEHIIFSISLEWQNRRYQFRHFWYFNDVVKKTTSPKCDWS